MDWSQRISDISSKATKNLKGTATLMICMFYMKDLNP